MSKQQYRLGIDAGGTFTDFILADHQGNVQLFKAPSTPHDGTLAIRNGLAQIADALGQQGRDPGRRLEQAGRRRTGLGHAEVERMVGDVGQRPEPDRGESDG